MVSLPKVQTFWSLIHKSTCLQHLVLLPGCNYAITFIPGKKTRKQKVWQVRQPFRWWMTASNPQRRVKLSINLLINMWVNKCNVYQREWRVSQFSSFIPSFKNIKYERSLMLTDCRPSSFDLIGGCWPTERCNIATYRTGGANRAKKEETNSKSYPLTVFHSDTYEIADLWSLH